MSRTLLGNEKLPLWRRQWFLPVIAFLVWRVWLYVFSWWVLQLEKPVLRQAFLGFTEFKTLLPQWIGVWSNFDGMVFLKISHFGYQAAELPFFPLLPLLMSSFSKLLDLSPTAVGILISALALPIGLFFSERLWRRDTDASAPAFLWFVLVLISFPTAHYYTAVYQDALFYALATATVWFARSARWKLAVLCAGVATLARLNGLALFVFLLVEHWLQVSPSLTERWSIHRLWKSLSDLLHWREWFGKHRYIWLFLLVPSVFLGYLGWIQWEFGNWHLFFSGVEIWNRDRFILPPQTFWRYAKMLVLTASVSFVYFIVVLEAAFTALYSWILIQQWGKLRLSYWAWILAHFTIPVVTGTLQGMPRYGLHLYPIFLVLALWSIRWPLWAKMIFIFAGFALQAWLALWFIRGYFVA
jgi:hypothetical protein